MSKSAWYLMDFSWDNQPSPDRSKWQSIAPFLHSEVDPCDRSILRWCRNDAAAGSPRGESTAVAGVLIKYRLLQQRHPSHFRDFAGCWQSI